MSGTQHGPGWWKASDGRWYPPEQHPGYEQHLAEHRAAMAEIELTDPVVSTARSPSTMFLVATIGAALIVVGAFLPWATVQSVLGVLSIRGIEGDGSLTLGGGVAVAALLVVRRRDRRAATASFAVSVLVGLVALFDMWNLASVAAEFEPDGPAATRARPGVWLTLAGAVVAAVGSLGVASGRE